MKISTKIIIHGAISLLSSILLGLLGLAVGATIWGNYPLPDMLGQVGYEGGGALGLLLGVSLGALAVTLILWKIWKGNVMNSFGLLFLGTILNVVIQMYSTFPYTFFILLIIPSAAAVIGFWWKK